MKFNKQNCNFLALMCTLALFACNNTSSEKKETETPVKKDTPVVEKKKITEEKPPSIINITDTLSRKLLVLYMKDSAATRDRISLKLGKIYGGKLSSIIKKNGLKVSGPPMAWYNTKKAPFYFEAGIPVEKKAGKIPANVFTREIAVDSVLVAHYYGKYDQLPQAYEALADILKGRKKTLQGKPYEIYVDDPMDKDGKLKDPYKVQTDIVFPWR
jgi:effector-binding domain-containing protein